MNPDYFEDLQPFQMAAFKALGLELWSMTSDIYFDNFIITSHKEVADRWASDSWGLKKLVASANEVSTMMNRHHHSVHFIFHKVLFSLILSPTLTIYPCSRHPRLSGSRGLSLS